MNLRKSEGAQAFLNKGGRGRLLFITFPVVQHAIRWSGCEHRGGGGQASKEICITKHAVGCPINVHYNGKKTDNHAFGTQPLYIF